MVELIYSVGMNTHNINQTDEDKLIKKTFKITFLLKQYRDAEIITQFGILL